VLDKIASDRLKILRFPLIVGVVFIHAYVTDVGFSNEVIGSGHNGWLLTFIRDLVSRGVARIAVPLFFLMSGYFFFLGLKWSLTNYKAKLKSRINSLLIPFLFWNILTLLVYAAAQYLPVTQIYFSGKSSPISEFRVYDYLNALIGINSYPISYQFWFIRDLMVLVVLSPMFFLIINYVPMIFLGVVSALWFVDFWPVYIPSSSAILFFYIGALMAISGGSLFRFDSNGNKILILYILILLIDVLTKGGLYNAYIHKTGILFGIASALYITQFALNNKKISSFLLWSSNTSFFVFAIHEPFLTITRKIVYKLLEPNSETMLLALYVSIPIVVIAVSMYIYVLLMSLNSRFVVLISGGR